MKGRDEHPTSPPKASCSSLLKLDKVHKTVPIPMAARFKAWVSSRSPAEIVGSNSTGGLDVCLL